MVLDSYTFQDIMDNATSRLQQLIDESGLNNVEVAKAIGRTKSLISNYLNPEKPISDSFLRQLEDKFGWSARWIRTGEGPKKITIPHHSTRSYLDEAKPVGLVDETEVNVSKNGMEFRDLDNGMVLMTMTLVPEIAYASYPHGWRDPEYLIELPKYSIVLPKREQGLFRAFEVRGDSMDDGTKYSISHGDVAVGRQIDPTLWNMKLYNNGGTDFIIVTHDGIICKRIIGHDIKEGTITCSSRNLNKSEFPNFPIRLSEVYELYKIRKIDRDWNHR